MSFLAVRFNLTGLVWNISMSMLSSEINVSLWCPEGIVRSLQMKNVTQVKWVRSYPSLHPALLFYLPSITIQLGLGYWIQPMLKFMFFNTLRPRQNGRHFADDIFKCIFLNENVWISLNISLNFAPRFRINNIPALLQIMAWRRSGDKPISKPMMTHICVARPHWINKDFLTWLLIDW